ncbi:MAG: protein kinase, partial [Paramuribaculum sp.]|nr:protein kinase [Paramuribaculum sp.]
MDNTIISGFGGVADNSAPFTVDFTKAELLDRSGSTCDAYEATVQRRRVFVKRLKAEYRDNPLYRAAFDKEYDLGVSLSHPSLPRYVGYGDDYVVMDFIEGDTLADLIQRGDSRLKDRKFVRRLLSELIDVAEYLHNRNVVHCDIKADNIMISPYSNRPATLIDLDKAYTPWLDSTHGNAGNYGCDSCADGAIDIKGIGMIASKLGMKRIAKACDAENVSLESLGELIRQDGRLDVRSWGRSARWILPAIVVAAVTVGIIGLIRYRSVPEVAAESVDDSIAGADSIVTAAVTDSSATVDSPREVSGERPSGPLTEAMKQGIDPDWIASLIAKKVTEYR